ncbi:MAG: HlyD family secretion protein [Verrucomicrobiales bacterium]
MDLLLILSYTGLCILVFKVFKVPLNKWTVPTAALIGVALVGILMLAMNYNHPHSRTATRTYITTPIMPFVRGVVTEVPVQPNQALKKGDVLFRIDPTPYQQVVDQKEAALRSARDMVVEMKDTVAELDAQVVRATAARDQAKSAYERFAKAGTGAASALQIEDRKQRLAQTEASLASMRSEQIRAKHQLESQIHNAIPLAEAELERARFDLDCTTVKAPGNGFVTQVVLRPGMTAVPVPLRPVMVFVHQDGAHLIASFRQNSLLRIDPGAKAEVTFPSMPGRVFQAKVDHRLPVLAEGEVQAQGQLYRSSQFTSPGLVPVVIQIEDESFPTDELPLGIQAEVAVYSEHLESVALIRKILLRMKGWQNYLYFDH